MTRTGGASGNWGMEFVACPSTKIGQATATEKRNIELRHQAVDRLLIVMPPPQQLQSDSLVCRE
jgi:hypothetical protein